MNPSFDEFRGMAHAGNLIPVYEEYPIHNETPVTCYEKIKEKAFSYVLESAQAENGWGRYSIIGWDPFVVAHLRDHQIEISRGEEREVLEARDPLHALRALMKGFKFVPSGDLPRFQGGLVGYFNYERMFLMFSWHVFRPVPLRGPQRFAPWRSSASSNPHREGLMQEL